MASRPRTPLHEPYESIPTPSDPAHLSRGYGAGSQMPQSHPGPATAESTNLAAQPGNLIESLPLSQSVRPSQHSHFNEELHVGGASNQMPGSQLPSSKPATPSRGGTLKKRASLSKKASVKRSGSKKGPRIGDVEGSLAAVEKDRYDRGLEDEMKSATYTPVPTSGNPTEVLSNRFQAWRKVLKDLVTYFRDIQISYESKAKALLKVSNVINNTSMPSQFLISGGIGEATHILRDYHALSIVESNKAKDIENDVIIQLNGLRSDLSLKIKEIKGLSGDFKNSVDKEMEGTRRAVNALHEALGLIDSDPEAAAGRGDPYLVKLGVDRQIERQIDEENYLHRAFLNLEGSGRELESIVMGEIQKAYNAYAGILKREADEAYETVEKLRSGPITLAKDREWDSFVQKDQHFVDPRLPIRRAEDIRYPGKLHPAATEVRAGMLERKSKYLKSYTPGWYVLSPTHLHEFKSADRIHSQPPIMSLFLPDQKLGSYSQPSSSSHKFMLKGRQTGAMHRGHSWVFRAESHDTMLAWYEDIKNLTEKSGEERNAFVRRHARSLSGGSQKAGSISSEGTMGEDEADQVPYSANASSVNQVASESSVRRPQPGGRFPSDLQVNRNLRAPLPPSSESSDRDRDVIAEASALPGSEMLTQAPAEHAKRDAYPIAEQAPQASAAAVLHTNSGQEPALAEDSRGQAQPHSQGPQYQGNVISEQRSRPSSKDPSELESVQAKQHSPSPRQLVAGQGGYLPDFDGHDQSERRTRSNYGDSIGLAAGAVDSQEYRDYEQQREKNDQQASRTHPDAPLAHSGRIEQPSGSTIQAQDPEVTAVAGQSVPQRGLSVGSNHRSDDGRLNTKYGEWMAPAFTGDAAAGGAAEDVPGVVDRLQHQHQSQVERPQQGLVEATSTHPMDDSGKTTGAESSHGTSKLSSTESCQLDSATNAPTTTHGVMNISSNATVSSHHSPIPDHQDIAASPLAVTSPVDARPALTIRSRTNQSISELHVPGEYPPTPAAI